MRLRPSGFRERRTPAPLRPTRPRRSARTSPATAAKLRPALALLRPRLAPSSTSRMCRSRVTPCAPFWNAKKPRRLRVTLRRNAPSPLPRRSPLRSRPRRLSRVLRSPRPRRPPLFRQPSQPSQSPWRSKRRLRHRSSPLPYQRRKRPCLSRPRLLRASPSPVRRPARRPSHPLQGSSKPASRKPTQARLPALSPRPCGPQLPFRQPRRVLRRPHQQRLQPRRARPALRHQAPRHPAA